MHPVVLVAKAAAWLIRGLERAGPLARRALERARRRPRQRATRRRPAPAAAVVLDGVHRVAWWLLLAVGVVAGRSLLGDLGPDALAPDRGLWVFGSAAAIAMASIALTRTPGSRACTAGLCFSHGALALLCWFSIQPQ